MDHIQITEQLRHKPDQFSPLGHLVPLGLSQALKELPSFWLYALDVAKAGTTLGDINAAQFARPVVEIGKQPLVDALQIAEVVWRGWRNQDSNRDPGLCRTCLRSSPCLLVGFQHRFPSGQFALGIGRLHAVPLQAEAGHIVGLAGFGAVGRFGLQAERFHGWGLSG